MQEKIILVEGLSDKKRLQEILAEDVDILCTNGTLSIEKISAISSKVYDKEVYIFVDADQPGNKLRNLLKNELPEAHHLYTRRMYREVARTPVEHLRNVLVKAHFEVVTPME